MKQKDRVRIVREAGAAQCRKSGVAQCRKSGAAAQCRNKLAE